MALQVWLPLNGNLDNQGLNNEEIIAFGNPTSSSDGKIGKCYSFDGSDDSIFVPFNSFINEEWSISVWFYKNTIGSKNYQTIFGGISGFEIEARNSAEASPVIVAWNWGKGTIPYEFNKWNHLVVTRNTSETKWYLNGELKLTGDAGTIPIGNYFIGAWNSSSQQNFEGKMNDFRIYDHCLSAKEVKEISKGLVCHYKLSGCGGENYFVNSNDGVSYTSTENSTYADVRMFINNDFWAKDNHNNYVVSFDWEISKPLSEITYCNLHWCESPWYSLKTLVIPENTTSGHYEYSGNNIPSEYYSPNNIFVRIGSTSGTADSWLAKNPGITFKLTNYKLEIGSKSTPWCPNPSDSLYSTLGYNDGIEYDCSGYGNNGTKVGNIVWCGDSARYSGSYYFPTNAYINCGKGGKIKDEITVNIWCYMDKWNDNIDLVCCTENGGWEIYNRNSHPTFNVFIPDIGYVTASSSKLWSDLSSGWHMFTGSYDGFNIKLYIDGILESSVSNGKSSKTSIYYNSANSIYIHAESSVPTPGTGYDACKLSDCRIYATALSEEDVKSLYSVSASIDKTGVLSAYEFVEEE